MRIKVDFCNSSFIHHTKFVSDEVLELTDQENCSFRQFLKICADKDFHLLDSKYEKMSGLFASSSFVAPLLIPRHVLKSKLDEASNEIDNVIEEPKNAEYLKTWNKIIEFLNSLKRAKVDKKALKALMDSKGTNNHKSFESFIPDSKGFTKIIKYNTCGTVTGRLTVESGPQILTTHHDVRKCLRSTFPGGGIYQIDFTAMEPRIALIESNLLTPDDVYADIADKFGNLTRKVLKTAILTALYGGSLQKIAEIVGDLELSAKLLEEVSAKFGLNALESRLNAEAQTGLVRNAFGRPLREATLNPRLRVNHFLQSSAAEASILLFRDFCNNLGDTVRPLFIIHDALIIDANELHTAQTLEKDFQKIKFRGRSMPVKIDTLSHN